MLSVILLPVLMILIPTLKVIRHLTCGNDCNCLWMLNLINEILWIGAGMLEKLNWFHLTGLITLVLLM